MRLFYRIVLWVLVGSSMDAARAQVLYGSIIGNVKDASGAAVAGAAVRLTGADSRQPREAVTNSEGGYDFATVVPGSYELKVSKPGFRVFTQTGTVAVANDIVRVDVT